MAFRSRVACKNGPMRQVDQVSDITPVPEGVRLVHIGPAKTGTTTLQGALHSRREELANHDVEYAGKRRHSRPAMVGIAYASPPDGYPADVGKRWRRLAAGVHRSRARRVILSSEILARTSPSRARTLVHDLGGHVQIVLTMRPLAQILASRWQQSVQDEMSQGYTDWLEDLFGLTPGASGRPSFWLRYDLGGHIRRWGPIVGEENITFIILNPQDRGMLLRSFEGLLGLPEGTLIPDPSLTNPSLGYPEIELLSAFNREFLAGGHGRAEFIRAVRGSVVGDLKTDPGRATSKIKTPRWAAEAANERAQTWIDAVRASDAQVIGDLEHLLVEPADFDVDPQPPHEISTQSAGELAYRMYRAGLAYGERSGRQARDAELADQAATVAVASPRRWRRKV